VTTPDVFQHYLTAKGTAIIVPPEDADTHCLLSPDDLRNVARLMPQEIFENLCAVIFVADPDDDQQDDEQPPAAGDVPSGRPRSIELIPGVFINDRYLGTYLAPYRIIRLYAYHYDPAALPQRAMWELFFRFRILTVFLHEVAHHVDRQRLYASGEGLLPPSEHREAESEQLSYPWVLAYGIPYLEQAYAEEVRQFTTWTEQYVGRRLSLADLVVPPRIFADEARVFTPNDTIFSIESLILRLATMVAEGHTMRDTRYNSALSFHCRGEYPEASDILQALLADDPHDDEAHQLYDECRGHIA